MRGMYQRPIDIFPVEVRGPLASGLDQIRFGRLFIRDNRLFIAASPDRGKTVEWVRSYPLPDEPRRMSGPYTVLGPWKFKSCGCASSWRAQTVEGLLARAVPQDQPSNSS